MRRIYLLVMAVLFTVSGMMAQTTLIGGATNNGNFEAGAASWTIVNATQTNKFFIGTSATAGFTGANSAYVSNNATGAAHTYTNTSTSVVHVYQDVLIPTGQSVINLNFNWINNGEAGFDYIKVYAIPTTTTPVAGTELSSGQVGLSAGYQGTTTWQSTTGVLIPGSFAGTTVRLVFSWRNDGSGGSQPPGGIDNVVLTSAAPAPICNSLGVYTIDNTLPNNAGLTGGNFSSFTSAINYINANGICGPLTFNVTAGQTFSENVPPLTATGTSANPIIFQKSGAGTNPIILATGTAGTADFAFGISGGDYITLDGIDILGITGAAVEYGYLIRNASATDGAQNNTIKNSTIRLSRTGANNVYGIYQTASSTGGGVVPTAASGANSTNKYLNITVNGARDAGVFLNGNGSFRDLNCEVGTTACTIRNSITNIGSTSSTFIPARGVYASAQENVKIYYNDISAIAGDQSGTQGIYFTSGYGNSEIYNNKIQNISVKGSTTTTSIAYGILAENVASTTITANVKIYNNFISNIFTSFTSTATATSRAIGMYLGVASAGALQSYDVDNNSISIGGGLTPTYSNACIGVLNAAAVYKIRGNIFANYTNAQGTTAKHYGIIVTAAAVGATGTVLNYNDYYIANDQSTSGHVGRNTSTSTNYNTLANWQTFATGLDVNSLAIDPVYANTTSDLHISASGLNAVSGFTAQSWVVNDIDCELRSGLSPHDIGADAIDACSGTPATSVITPATASRCVGLTYTMAATGATAGLGISYQWQVSTTSGSGYVDVTGGTGATTLSYTTAALTSGVYYYVLKTTCANGGATSLSNELVLTVNALPTVSVSPTASSYCSPGGTAIALTASGAATYAWSPAAGLSATTGVTVNASPSITTPYVVTGTDANGCINTATSTITVNPMPVITSVTATPATICNNDNSQLKANVSTVANAYQFTSGTSTFTPITGGTTIVGGNADSYFSGTLPIGFNFNYNGSSYSNFYFSSNGFISLTASIGTGTANALATASSPVIAPLWDDLDGASVGAASYITTGSAPNRVLTVQWLNWEWGYLANAATISFQAKLYESDGHIEFNYRQDATALNSPSASIGISGAVGNYLSLNNATATPTASSTTENSTISLKPATDQLYTFTPPSLTYVWTPTTFIPSGQEVLANPLATALTTTTTYNVTATYNGCTTAPSPVTVTVSSGAVITQQPVATTKCAGDKAFFKAKATGATLTYQWQKNGVDVINGGTIGGATTDSLYIDGVVLADADTYTVIVSSACGSPVTSSAVTLTVNPLPTLTIVNPAPVCAPATVDITSATVQTVNTGTTTKYYTTLALANAGAASNVTTPTAVSSGTYFIRSENATGCFIVQPVTVVVNSLPTGVTATPSATTICAGASIDLTTPNAPGFPILSEGFEGATTGWTVASGGPVNNWFITSAPTGTVRTGTKCAEYFYSSTNAANAWLFTPAQNLTGGVTYTISSWYRTSTSFPEKLKVTVGNSNTIAAQTTTIQDLGTIQTGTYTFQTATFTPATSGTYYFAWNAYSAANQYYIDLDDVSITVPQTYSYSWSSTPAGYTSSIQNPTGVTPNNGDVFTVTATSALTGCSASASTVTINVVNNATITQQPLSVTKCAGDKAFFKVKATGVTLTYQWQKNGVNITNGGTIGGATTDSLYINGVVLADADTYTVIVSSACGSPITSSAVTLAVNAKPTVPVSPASTLTFCANTPTALDASGTNAAAIIGYQWINGAAAVSGATSATHTPTASGSYRVRVQDGVTGCFDTSAVVVVTVNTQPSAITVTPSAPSLCAGNIQLLTATGGISASGIIGTGTSFTAAAGEQTAFCNRRLNYVGQTIYTASELLAAGVAAGNITSMAYNISSNGDASTNANYTVKIGQVGSTVVFPSTSFFTNTSYTTVYGPATYTHSSPGWQTITFTTLFVWDGVSNICVDVRHDGIDAINNAQTQFTTTSGNASIHGYNTPVTGTLSTSRLNIKFTPVVNNPITWSPLTGLFTDAAATVAYTGTSATSVYAKPGSNTTYTVTATGTNTCTITSNVTITATGVTATTPISIDADVNTYALSGTTPYMANCRVIAEITPGTVSGTVLAKTAIVAPASNGVEPYGPRVIDLEPTVDGTGTVKLYFKQSHFDSYNTYVTGPPAIAYTPAPTTISDVANAANVRIRQFHGPNATFATNTGTDLLVPTSVVYDATGDNGTGWWVVTVNAPSFSSFYQTTTPIVTPVTLSSIRGELTGTTNTVYWSTVTESNSNKFVVQRSTDGVQFNTLGEVATKAVNGNSNSLLNYNFIDANPIQGKAYYKLQIIDNNNAVKYSPIVTLRRGAGKLEIVDVRPNPTTGTVYFNVLGTSNSVTVAITDLTGKVVISKGLVQSNNFSINMSGLANGIYILAATDTRTGEKSVFKVVKN